jgi:hypothetical protein
MAFDSTPQGLDARPDTDGQELPRGVPRIRRRSVVIALLLASFLAWLGASGAVAEARHALAHAFPDLMIDGCGEPGG